uniref:Polygalacturonase-inhibiting protein n=1 Tax=Knorringia sibirica TaxID=328376 RepID=B2ZCQ4_9CARY|nr:polygalacturonase-inhibiting protein [Knorringia sibirica]
MGNPQHHFILYSSAPFLLLLLTAPVSTSANERCHPDDKKVLLGIQKYYKNAYIFSSWSASTDCCTDWYMVGCDETTNRIKYLTVQKDGLSGVIAPAVGDLPYLTSLDFHKLPNITGPIPASIAKLSRLESLTLDYNSLTGPIPEYLHTLKKLNYINLSFNKLSGSTPASLPLTPSLDYLRLDHNMLTGSIPDTIGSIKNGEIYGLYLSYNQLTGTIPNALGKLNITVLYLSKNKLTGDASFLFGKNKPANQMDLSRNQLSFDFSKVEIPSEINWLLLDHNQIYGSLPASLTKLTNMNNFNVSYNRLCGKIPNGGRLGEFNKYSFIHNKCLCGSPLDACK